MRPGAPWGKPPFHPRVTPRVGAGPHALIVEDGGGDPYDPEVPEVKLIAALGEPGTHRKIVNRCAYNQAQGCT